MLTAQLITPSRIIEARPGWDVPTKTRLDLNAGGDGPPAEPERAQGSGPGSNSSSSPPAQDAAGFIDALNALSSHIKERERLEQEARRPWTLMVVAGLVLLAFQGILDLLVASFLRSYPNVDGTTPLSLVLSAAGTAMLALAIYGKLATAPLRLADDSIERVALRHEDSPLRDRIRIAQWILLDTALTRFSIAERAITARQAQGILLISAWATMCTWIIVLSIFLIPIPIMGSIGNPWAPGHMATLALFLGLVVASILLTRRWAFKELHHAQHFGRQVMAFDRDFGGFLPRVERERVERIVNLGGSKGNEPPDA